MKPSMGASSAFSASKLVPKAREGEEVEVGQIGVAGRLELLGNEHAEQVHAGGLLEEPLSSILPGPSGRASLVVRHEGLPLVEDGENLRIGPLVLAGHQVDMELVAVHAQVEDVEGTHGRPAILVAEGDRDEAVLLHLVAEGGEVGQGGRDRVALGREDALAVEEGPRVVVDRDEVLMAVVARGTDLEGVREVGGQGARPDVVDRGRETLSGEEAHAEAREPGEDVIRLGAEVARDLVLERAVVNGVDRDFDGGLGREGVGHVLPWPSSERRRSSWNRA